MRFVKVRDRSGNRWDVDEHFQEGDLPTLPNLYETILP